MYGNLRPIIVVTYSLTIMHHINIRDVIINVVIIQILQHSSIHCAYVLQLTFDIGLGTIRLRVICIVIE